METAETSTLHACSIAHFLSSDEALAEHEEGMTSAQEPGVEAGVRHQPQPQSPQSDAHHAPNKIDMGAGVQAKIADPPLSDKTAQHTYPPTEKVVSDDQSSTNHASEDSKDDKDDQRDHMRLRDMSKGEFSYHKREHWW